MREIGFILLLVGFAASCWFSLVTHPAARSVMVSHYEHMPSGKEMYSREEVEREIRGTAFDSLLYSRFFIIPGVMMLIGGLVVSTGPRRNTQNRETPNI